MSTIRVSKADLLKTQFAFSDEEKAHIDSATDEELRAAALADPDNPPWTSEMFEIARQRRRRRLALEGGVELRPAIPSDEAGIWAVTDTEGRTVFIQAAKIELAERQPSGPLYEIVPVVAIGQS